MVWMRTKFQCETTLWKKFSSSKWNCISKWKPNSFISIPTTQHRKLPFKAQHESIVIWARRQLWWVIHCNWTCNQVGINAQFAFAPGFIPEKQKLTSITSLWMFFTCKCFGLSTFKIECDYNFLYYIYIALPIYNLLLTYIQPYV